MPVSEEICSCLVSLSVPEFGESLEAHAESTQIAYKRSSTCFFSADNLWMIHQVRSMIYEFARCNIA